MIYNFWYISISLKKDKKLSVDIFNIICIEKAFSDKSKHFTFNENMFNSAVCLTCYTPWLFLLFEYKRVCKSCVTNAQTRQYYFFLSGFSLSLLLMFAYLIRVC